MYIGRNVDETMKLKIHWNATAIATAAPRMMLGKISEMSTQQIGPQLNMNDALYTMMLITATTGGRAALTLVTATPAAPRAIPSEPTIRRGLRPSFSTVKIAIRVNVMFTIPMRTVCIIGLPIPSDSKIRGAK